MLQVLCSHHCWVNPSWPGKRAHIPVEPEYSLQATRGSPDSSALGTTTLPLSLIPLGDEAPQVPPATSTSSNPIPIKYTRGKCMKDSSRAEDVRSCSGEHRRGDGSVGSAVAADEFSTSLISRPSSRMALRCGNKRGPQNVVNPGRGSNYSPSLRSPQ